MPRRPDLLPRVPSAPELPVVHRARDHPPAVVAGRVRAGTWVRVGRGAYVDAPDSSLDRYARARHLTLAGIAAADDAIDTDHVLSHGSAAVLWGLPLLDEPSAVHVIQGWSATADMSPRVRRHVLPLRDDEVDLRRGRRVTSLERTAVDCAMRLGAEAGLVVMDAALHHGADRELCRELLARRSHSPGVRVGRAVLAAADDGAESPGETRARLALIRLGVVPPRTQVPVETHRGRYWCDLGWEEYAVVGEYDGVAKYAARGSVAAEVLREKQREEAIVEAGRRVLRIISADLARPSSLHARVRKVLPASAFGVPVDPYLR